MSLPPELRVLCFHLSSTPAIDLPRLTPALLCQVQQCKAPLSNPSANSAKADTSTSSVLVHKLKIHLTTLLNGKSPEGRFAAVVLIKGVVEVGGWEVLQSSEPWVRGLLSALSKPESVVTKEMCIITLTKIYCMTHQYQTLVREITTPTLPTFVTTCLNLIPSKSPGKSADIPPFLTEVIFRSFTTLLPRHPTIYRPFVSQIRVAIKPYLAPTLADGFVSSSLRQGARCLNVALHQTVAKGAGGEEWSKALRELVKGVHLIADQVFRAVVEDWESVVGYTSSPVDVNKEPSGSEKTPNELPNWTGITNGIERLVGLLGMLEEYFKSETSTPVALPLGSIIDMTTRLLSIVIPSPSQMDSGSSNSRLHPAIDREERDVLWSGLPGIYIATLRLINAIADRLQESFLSLAATLLDQLAWTFPSGKHDTAFRLVTYQVLSKVFLRGGQGVTRKQSSKLSKIIRSCCNDLLPDPKPENTGTPSDIVNSNGKRPLYHNLNADTFLQRPSGPSHEISIENRDIVIAASNILPLFLSHIPQQYLDVSLRALIERTAILTHNKDAMLASVLNPFVGKNGKLFSSILPHLTREFQEDQVVELLLRPRLPMIPSGITRLSEEEGALEIVEDEDTEMHNETSEAYNESHLHTIQPVASISTHHELGNSFKSNSNAHSGLDNSFTTTPTPEAVPAEPSRTLVGDTPATSTITEPQHLDNSGTLRTVSQAALQAIDVRPVHDGTDSDDESVHLTMGLDTDSSDSDG